MIPVFYSESYVLAQHEFDTTRKARWVSDSLGHRPVPGARLDLLDDASAYLPTLERRLEGLDSTGASFDLCLYNAGMDPFEECPIGGLDGMTQALLLARDRTVFAWCASRRIPVAFVLARGYIAEDSGRDRLVELHRGTIAAAAHPAP